MAAWLKAAEGLFEVVDRQAKLVVNELSEEQSDSLPPASSEQGSQPKKTKPKPKSKSKAQKRLPKEESTIASEPVQELARTQPLEAELVNRSSHSVENDENASSNSIDKTRNEQQQTTDIVASSVAPPESTNEPVKHEADSDEIPVTVTDPVIPSSNSEILNNKASDVPEKDPPSPSPVKETEVVEEHKPIISVLDTRTTENDVSSKTELEKSSEDSLVSNENSAKDDEVKLESLVHQKNKHEHKTDATPGKIQEQLEEAQGLLKTANATGQSKEARLARVCAGLSTRLQEYKSENAQLEELLIAERELSKSYEAHIMQLQQDLSMSKVEVTRVESNMTEALAAKNAEIGALLGSMDALKKQAASSEGSLASLQGILIQICIATLSITCQANMESLMRNRELNETRMMQALREELLSVERRAEEERVAHNATKKAAMEREMNLENRAVEESTALARTQRIADERTAKVAELEQKVALLEVECATLNQELQDMEARVRRGQKKSPEDLNQSIQAWQEEVERARQGQRDAENKHSSVEAELQKLRVEMAAMKRDAEHYSRQEHTELEKRYRELTDLLVIKANYYKQTQLETMASEKAAAEFQLEKEMKRLQEVQVEAERNRVAGRPSTSWEEDAEMKTLEPLPVYHRHLVGASMQLQKAAKLLDSGAARATRFLWRYPTARLIFLFYLEQADNLSAREVAESMGLSDPKLSLLARR
ncbi:Golgin candidate 1 [Linum perenne]